MADPATWGVEETRAAFLGGRVTAREIATSCLARIEARRDLNAFLHVDSERVVEEADRLDRRPKDAELVLAGVPVAVKDNILVEGLPATAGSRILTGFVPPYSATAVERLRAAGAIVVGKTNLDEFGMGSSSENSGFGRTENPAAPGFVPGGSSSGSAAAVAARLVPVALGSDTGGSVRQPAAFTGITGLKPSYGRVSRYGLIAYGSSLDQIGVLARSPADAAAALGAISGHDRRDSTSSRKTAPSPRIPRLGEKLRIGVLDDSELEGVDPDILAGIEALARQAAGDGHLIVPVSLPHSRYAVAAYYIIAMAEASSNLSRYDGVRFGHRVPSEDLDELYTETRTRGFGREVQRRILLGTFVLSAGFYDAYYARAQKVRRLICQDFDEAFEKVDLLLTPTTPTPPFGFGEKASPLEMYLSDVFTVGPSLAGLPAASIPIGFAADGRPIGAQLIGRMFGEDRVLQFAQAVAELPVIGSRR